MMPELARAPTAAQASRHTKRIPIIDKLAVADQGNDRVLARTTSGTMQGGRWACGPASGSIYALCSMIGCSEQRSERRA
jgi:hypothetical protein